VPKSLERVEAYGDVDELNSVLGGLVAVLPGEGRELIQEIQGIQSDLLHVGAWLATMPDSPSVAFLRGIGEAQVKALEKAIDRMEQGLPPLRTFVLPGGHVSAAWAHVARTVCRRAERRVVRLSMDSGDSGRIDQLGRVIVYLNRLSDYLFVLARHCNLIQGVPDRLWKE
jgi:cob(I)alamin adenosyltransferase